MTGSSLFPAPQAGHGVENTAPMIADVASSVTANTFAIGLPLGRLLAIAIPMIDAVAAAHQKGITHRDLKPANVMVGLPPEALAKGGRVKVLDFGLAKLSGGALAGDGATALPTALATGEGRILGTVAYMSPEQAEGKPIDARSDVFSLGVMLYEMATGRRPFTGDTSISIISAIVKDTPTSVTDVNPALPREFARIVRRALTKDLERRYQTAKDLRNDLEELKASLDSGELTSQSPAVASAKGTTQKWVWIAGAAVVAIAAVAIALNLSNRTQGGPATPTVQLVALTSTGNVGNAALSPDGKFVAYSQENPDGHSLWVHQIASKSTLQILPPQRGGFAGLTVTPDNAFVDYIRFESRQWSMWRVPLIGGTARKIVDRAMSPPGWSPDGTQMAYLVNVPPVNAERQLVVANADATNPRVVATRKLPQRYLTLTMSYRPDVRPVWLADGKSIVVQTSDEVAAPGDVQLVRVDVATGAESVLQEFRGGVAWSPGMGVTISPDGRSIFATLPDEAGAPAQVVRIDVATGARTRLTNDLATYGGVTIAGETLVTLRSDARSSLWVADANGRGERAVGRELPSRFGTMTWAGSRVLYVASLAGGFGVWSTDLTGSSQLILPGASRVAASLDGKTLAFQKGAREVWRADADGSHATRLPDVVGYLSHIAPDGSHVFLRGSRSGVQAPWVADVAGGKLRQFAVVQDNGAAISRDGRRVMVRSNADDAPGLFIYGPDGGEPLQRLPLVPADGDLRWTPDSASLAYVDRSFTTIMALSVAGGPARPLASFARGDLVDFDWSPDGKQLALVREVVTTDIVLVKGVR